MLWLQVATPEPSRLTPEHRSVLLVMSRNVTEPLGVPPPLDVLTRLWTGEAGTVPDLQKALADEQTPTDLESSLAYLLDKDYLTRDNDAVQLTPEGALAREDIERDTDKIYFAPWPHGRHVNCQAQHIV